MVPTTLEGCVPVSEAGGARGGSISLAMLIDFIVQRTYHELTVLADLLPRKTDMERKVEIYKLSARTRQLFVRLLALVKWAGSASKVDRSAQIMGFLDKQALLFVDTADMLARMARETLVHARLPTFHIPAAVEVLTQGTYARLPVCIRDRLVPPSGLTVAERRTTLRALNHVIRQRLVTCALPDNMRTFKVENGRVTFQVGQEFSVSLTVMGDSPNLPWRLLDVAILVQDSEIGEGKPLVHPRQVSYIRGVAQAHLAGGGGGGGLRALLAVLGYFCRSLQLELLYTQTLRLARDRLGQHLRVHQYVPGRRLTISYWRELGCELGYRVSVQADSSSPGRPLSACHVPQLGPEQEAAAARALHGPRLSVEHLLATTIHVRSKARLQDLKALLTDMGVECTLGGSPCVLACCVLWPCLRAEQLLVAVGVHCGSLRCHVPQHPHAPAPALPQALAAGDRAKLKPLLADLRFWLMARRCEKTLQHLPAQATERLPLITPPNHPLTKLSPHRLYVTLHRHANHILVVEMIPDGPGGVKLCFHLSRVKRCGPEEEDTDSDQGGAFLRVQSLVQFDTFVLTHGPFTPVDAPGGGGKRKALVAGRSVRSKQPAYFLPELAHVVAAADERIPFVYLAQELSMKGVCHGGLQVEPCGGPALRLVSLPCPWGEGEGAGRALLRRLLSASVRVMPRNQARVWTAEFVFHSSPIRSASPKEQGMRRCVYFQYEMCAEGAARNTEGAARAVDALMQDWNMVVRLHDLVHHYSQRDHAEREAAEAHVSIVSYDYRRLVLGAGPGGLARCAVTWAGGRLRLRPAAAPGAVNAHALIHHQLEDFLNRSKDLLQLMAALKETYAPLVALGRLPSTPHLGLQQSRPQVPVQAFTLVPQSWRKIRVAYQGAYCLEVAVRGGGVVAIRDGAYSRFDRSAVVGEFTPTQGLKSFLSLYVSESTSRVVSEDDNPPSPVSPREGGGLRFPAPLTPPAPHTPHSQPHTPHPASPHQGHGSSFNLTSPPMLGGAHVSPASPQHPGASPLSQHMPTHSSPTQPYMPGSPFTWPGSPSVPRPSPARSQEHKVVAGPGRVLVGGRAWAGAVATPLPVSALEALCLPCEAPSGAPSPPMPPLERFLGAVYMRRHLQRFIQQPQQDSTLTLVACPEPGVVMFRAEDCGLTGRVALHPVHMQSLQLTLAALPDHKDQWTTEELQVIEKYFEQRVVCPPYKPNSVWGWGRAWGAPAGVLRDLVQLMRHELGAGPGAPQAWELQWALRIPPQAVPHIIPTAQPAVLLARNKILLFLSLSRHDCEVVLPLVHDFSTNVTQLAEKREPGAHHAPTSLQHQALIILKRFADYNTVLDQCSLWLAIRDLLANLQVPSDFIRNSQMNVMGDINARR